MKAKTKNQKRVVEVDSKIKKVSKTIKNWAIKNVLKKRGVRYKSGTLNCLECGHSWKSTTKQAWQDQITEIKCPCCKNVLEIKSTNNRTFYDSNYFSHVTKAEEYQLIKTFQIGVNYKCKEKATYTVYEVQRVYVNNVGKAEIIARLRGGGFYSYSEGWRGWLELRDPKSLWRKYNEQGDLYEKWDLHDYVIEKGFNAYSYNESQYTVAAFLVGLLQSPHAETVLKDGRTKLFDYLLRDKKYYKYWPTIKICIRNKYDMINIQSYFDMISALEYFNKDLRNSKFVCPDNFHEAHDYWINKRAVKIKDLRKLEQLKKLTEKRNEYNLRMEKFSKLSFKLGKLKIVPILTIDEVERAGELMHHCIYKTESHWQDSDNLLFGAYYNGKLVETSEYVLSSKHIEHSLGLQNKESKYHKTIVGLLNNSTPTILQCLKPKRKSKSKATQELQVA